MSVVDKYNSGQKKSITQEEMLVRRLGGWEAGLGIEKMPLCGSDFMCVCGHAMWHVGA